MGGGGGWIWQVCPSPQEALLEGGVPWLTSTPCHSLRIQLFHEAGGCEDPQQETRALPRDLEMEKALSLIPNCTQITVVERGGRVPPVNQAPLQPREERAVSIICFNNPAELGEN